MMWEQSSITAKTQLIAVFTTVLLITVLFSTCDAKRGGGGGSRGGSRGGGRSSSGGSRSSGSSSSSSSGSSSGSGRSWFSSWSSSSSSAGKTRSGTSVFSSSGSRRTVNSFSLFRSPVRGSYTSNAVRSTSFGQSFVPYRSIRPLTGSIHTVPVIYSPIRYRPPLPTYFYFFPSFYYYRIRSPYYRRYHHRYWDRSYTSTPGPYGYAGATENQPPHEIFADIAEHCDDHVYGIDGQEQYFISSLGQYNSTEATVDISGDTVVASSTNSTALNFTSDCLFTIEGPDDAVLHVVFNSSNCVKWPSDCQITVKEHHSNDQDNATSDHLTLLQLNSTSNLTYLMANMSADGSCTLEVFSTLNHVAINVTSCSANLALFDFSLTVEVAVEVDDGGFSMYRIQSPFTWLLMMLIAAIFMLSDGA